MPNHWHAIVLIDGDVETLHVTSLPKNPTPQSIDITKYQSLLCVTIRGIKASVTKYAHENNLDFAWQTRFHDHIIRDQNEMNRIADYIQNNPAMWADDCYYTQA